MTYQIIGARASITDVSEGKGTSTPAPTLSLSQSSVSQSVLNTCRHLCTLRPTFSHLFPFSLCSHLHAAWTRCSAWALGGLGSIGSFLQ
jgi:hypothetical protein